MSNTDAPEETTTALGQGLKVRHLTMMGLGSAIGAGLFLGTGVGIATAGPAVLLSYIIAGAVVVFVMRMLGEMGAAIPASGSFSHYARLGIGEWAGFVMGWLYWFMLIMVLGAEITGASAIVNEWLPSIPQWMIALVFVVFFAIVNLAKVSNFGEFEFWFAAIKVTVIIGFLIIGVLLVFGLLPDTDPVGTSNLFGQGGFMPNGFSGVAAGLLVVAFAFGGIEIVTIAAAESENPERSIALAVRSVVWRISVFYIGAISIMVLVLPWNDPDLETSPFVSVLNLANIPGVAGFMELVVVVALLSAFNANIYGTSRMAFSLSRRGDGPAFMAKLSNTGVPTNAVLLSVFFGFVSVMLNWLLPDDLLGILLNAVGAALLVIWIFIVISHLRLRKQLEAEGKLTIRMWLFPYLSYATLAMLGAFVVLMLFDEDARDQLISTAVLFAVIAALGYANSRWRRTKALAENS
ncbi:amino acid permease [Rhodococcus sp. AD45-ID]|uniref:amino acid permease n=1 Tax=unclassified Rhodococcus (in: high G+C Gram-positive bacteria) TaxID=192944 RepID=UPI0005D33C8C|nr:MULTISPECIES: amino acid permease [unclassified Rhodococcus (in: high G+C Gram-positive bacteria)]KJF21592.1 Gamma-aminobutyrate permease [Rhodococcus sp. AD45]PSR39053.1 amino acid permease [Rhodococcus sp. AD45-ID]